MAWARSPTTTMSSCPRAPRNWSGGTAASATRASWCCGSTARRRPRPSCSSTAGPAGRRWCSATAPCRTARSRRTRRPSQRSCARPTPSSPRSSLPKGSGRCRRSRTRKSRRCWPICWGWSRCGSKGRSRRTSSSSSRLAWLWSDRDWRGRRRTRRARGAASQSSTVRHRPCWRQRPNELRQPRGWTLHARTWPPSPPSTLAQPRPRLAAGCSPTKPGGRRTSTMRRPSGCPRSCRACSSAKQASSSGSPSDARRTVGGGRNW